MPYNYEGTGYLSDAVTTDTGRKIYLFTSGGYLGSITDVGYKNFGTRVLDDGATIESYACVSAVIKNSPTADAGRQLFDIYNTSVISAGGSTEARACTITELNEIL